MRKGDLVRLCPETCFTKFSGGLRTSPLWSFWQDNQRMIWGTRPMTEADLVRWHADPQNQGLNDAGETKLPPEGWPVEMHADIPYIVVRARCKYRRMRKVCLVLDTRSGQEIFVQRKYLEPYI